MTAAIPPLRPEAAATGGSARIYRLKVRIVTTSASEDLSLGGPATLITGRARVRTGPVAAGASFGSFGSGPLHVERSHSSGKRRVEASFVVALTPSGSQALKFVSRKPLRGKAVVTIDNLNRDKRIRIRRFVHRRSAGTERSFSIPTARVARRGPVPGTGPLEPKVYAFYYPWYKHGYWFGGSMARYNQNDKPYSSGDPEAIARHVRQARKAGIDGFISSWWGRGHLTDENLPAVFEELPAHGFKVAIYFETLSDNFQTKGAIVRELAYALDTYGSRSQYLRFRGKPVVYFYATQHVLQPSNPAYRTVWRSVFKTLKRRGYDFKAIGAGTSSGDLGVFDGLNLYSSRTTPSLHREMALTARAWAAVHGGGRRVWAATAAPGYDDRHIQERSYTTYIPRGGGSYYRSQWAGARSVKPEQVIILSFNEWFETTNIEPNRRWGSKYLKITADEVAAFKRAR